MGQTVNPLPLVPASDPERLDAFGSRTHVMNPRRPSFTNPYRTGLGRPSRRGLTLIELLVVGAILVLLIGLLLPAMGRSRSDARTLNCRVQVKSLMTAAMAYATTNDDWIVPSYNMKGITGSRTNPLDGWGPILDQEGFIQGSATLEANPFACPETANRAGVAATNRGANADDPSGYLDWPLAITFTGAVPTTIPQRGFTRTIRVSYWINGENPIGAPRPFEQSIHYTGSVGFGPDGSGRVLRGNRIRDFRFPARLIALADGVYAGNQHATRPGQTGLRIGYRHGFPGPAAMAGFADGHAELVGANSFPRRWAPGSDIEEIRNENLGTGPTVYADPDRFLSRP